MTRSNSIALTARVMLFSAVILVFGGAKSYARGTPISRAPSRLIMSRSTRSTSQKWNRSGFTTPTSY